MTHTHAPTPIYDNSLLIRNAIYLLYDGTCQLRQYYSRVIYKYTLNKTL